MVKVENAFTGGFTLIECSLVVALLSVVALLAVARTAETVDRAKETAAVHDLTCMRDALLNDYLSDMRGIPGFSIGFLRLANLCASTNLYGIVTEGKGTFAVRRVDSLDETGVERTGCAAPAAFTRWDPEAERGWRGPYVAHVAGEFPSRLSRRFADDATAEARGFFPDLRGLREPDDFLDGRDGCSIYGFPGEPALVDPWGNPYVLQIPPPQAFPGTNTNVSDEVRFRYARLVSAGPDGRLVTPCFDANATNQWATSWAETKRRLARQAGRLEGDVSARGDDVVVFLCREDVDEGADE